MKTVLDGFSAPERFQIASTQVRTILTYSFCFALLVRSNFKEISSQRLADDGTLTGIGCRTAECAGSLQFPTPHRYG